MIRASEIYPANAFAPRAEIDSYAAALQECSRAQDLAKGRQTHARIVEAGCNHDRFLCNLLVRMYGECGSIGEASSVFDSIHVKNLYSWSIMISACVQNGQGLRALKLLWNMDQEGISPDRVVLIEMLGACSHPELVLVGKALHDRISKLEDLRAHVFAATAVISMYGRCGYPELAVQVFNGMELKTVVSWNAMLTAYAQRGYHRQCLQLFEDLTRLSDVSPNAITFVVVVDACSLLGDLDHGRSVHERVASQGLESDHIVGTCLLNMYSRCGSVTEARNVFDKLERPNVVSWTSMIAAYANHSYDLEALQLLRRMDLEGAKAEEMTLVNALGACSNLKALEEGRKIHARLSSSGIQSDFSASALVNMYSRAGSLEEARDAFRSRKNRNEICWTAMLAAYAQHGHNHDALRLYKEMDLEGLRPDDVTHAAVLGACACLGALAEGRRVHRRILSTRSSSGLDVVLGTATVNMYAKCGRVDEAKLAFDGISDKSVFCWTAMVGAYARNGHGEKAVELFREMVESSRTLPNDVTFTTVLNACSHAGLVDEGKYFFALMDKVYGIAPSGEHYGCMIDLLGRAGRLEEAERMITGMPFPADKISWETLLGACKLHGDTGRGARVAEQALRMDPENAANYVILSDLYFARGKTNMN